MTFHVFISHKRHVIFLIVMIRDPLSNFDDVSFLLTSLQNGLFLTSSTPTLPILQSGDCNIVGS